MLSHHPSRKVFLVANACFLIPLLLSLCDICLIATAFFFPHQRHGLSKTSLLPPCAVLSASSSSSLSSTSQDDIGIDGQDAIRLNKVLKATHSRREADALIASGRIRVNGQPIETKGGFKVVPFVDVVELDGNVILGWEEMNGISKTRQESPRASKKAPKAQGTIQSGEEEERENNEGRHFEYIKYWKPRGVTCTTDRSIESNIIDDILANGLVPKHRIYPVGRLDKDTSGLILLTSDGRLPNSVLRGATKHPKTYRLIVDRTIRKADIRKLTNGVVITTVAQRDGKRSPPLTQRTLPCEVSQTSPKGLEMTLMEGRNRQIRKMLASLQYTVVKLHRVEFMGIDLHPLERAGEWNMLDDEEMTLVDEALSRAIAGKQEESEEKER